MAFPYTTEVNFEDGTAGHLEAGADTESRRSIDHYTTLAAYRPSRLPMPFRGAYCLRVNLSNDGTPADAYYQETGSWDLTAGTNELYVRFLLYVTSDITMATTNEFAVFEFWSSTNTPEAGAYVNYTTANGLRLGIGKASAAQFQSLTPDVWHSVELFFDPAGSSNGTLDGFLDGVAFTQVTGLSNASITSGVVGVLHQDAGTTRGHVLFDHLVTDDGRIGPLIDRNPKTIELTASGHVFVGDGEVCGFTLNSGGGTDNVARLFDTDTGTTTDPSNVKSELRNTANNQTVQLEGGQSLRFVRGCYVSLAGTGPRATITIKRAPFYRESAQRRYARWRSTPPTGS